MLYIFHFILFPESKPNWVPLLNEYKCKHFVFTCCFAKALFRRHLPVVKFANGYMQKAATERIGLADLWAYPRITC
jgi:hypothetical protein